MALLAVLLLGLAAAGCGSGGVTTRPVASKTPEVPTHNCGTLPGPGATFSIVTGSASCAEARQVFSDLFAGGGTRVTSPEAGAFDTNVNGWLCGGGAGGFGCGKDGQVIDANA